MYINFATAADDIKPAPLPKTLGVYRLKRKDIKSFLALQALVRDNLPDDQKHHLKERTAEDLAAHLYAGMPMIGVKTASGELVGQALVSFPTNDAAKNLDGYPLNDIEQSTAIVQSLTAHPDYKGVGQILHAATKTVAQEHGLSYLMGKVADTNLDSANSFLRAGFSNAAHGIDPNKGYEVTYFLWESAASCNAASQSLALNGNFA